MDQRKAQRVCDKSCANLEKSATETLTTIQQDFGDKSSSRTQVFRWHNRLKTGRTSVDDDEHTQEDPQVAQLLKQLHEFNSSSVRIDVEPFASLLRRWELVMGRANGF